MDEVMANINKSICDAIDEIEEELWKLNQQIYTNPELGYEEFQAHENIVSLLTSRGFQVTPHAYELSTSFCAEYGVGGRLVIFNAEYDALPRIGHACGHNLIAVAAVAAFTGVAAALRETGIAGRVRLLGTPAEEGGGGKLHLIRSRAYENADACLMVHPQPHADGDEDDSIAGLAYVSSLANSKFRVNFAGKEAHAAAWPEQGINALDALVLGYNAVSMLRQQMRSSDRVHGIIVEGGTRANIITARGVLEYHVRTPSIARNRVLTKRVKDCFKGAAQATGCNIEFESLNEYADLRPNIPLCRLFSDAMSDLGSKFSVDETAVIHGSTDMGNVSYICPSIHAMYGIPSGAGAGNHTAGFATAAGGVAAHRLTVAAAKGISIAGWRVLSDYDASCAVAKYFEQECSDTIE